ncbi:MAG: FecR domain-containing protein [Myxococcales bacterium]|nr:FecR domain-containing protein [Myxococcales bacterium]
MPDGIHIMTVFQKATAASPSKPSPTPSLDPPPRARRAPPRARRPRRLAHPPRRPPPRPLHLPEGITARPLTRDGHVELTHLSTDHLALRLTAGAARFTVPPGPGRTVSVDAGAARIVADGAVFELHRPPTDRGAIELTVTDGAVRVHTDRAVERVTAGERRRYPPGG